MATVRLEHVTKEFTNRKQKVCAVDDLCLEASDGELLVLVGPSGCGKSTTLRLIAGLDAPSSGDIHIGERNVARVAPKDRDIAMVFQNYALYPHMTVRKNMAFGLKMRRTPRDEINRRITEAADKLGLTALLDRKPGTLSGGECQRVALGRAIVRKPNVFLLDEPLSNLDARLRLRMRTEIKALHQDLGTTMIYVTHDQEEAMTLGRRLAVMKDGRVQQCDEPMNIYTRPANRFVAGFIGTPTMSFFTGRLVAQNGQTCFEGNVGRLPLPSDITASDSQSVVLGLRPEDFSLSASQTAASTSVEAVIDLVEPLGDRLLVHLAIPGGDSFVVRVSPTTACQTGRTVLAEFNMRNAHLFSADDTGRRLN